MALMGLIIFNHHVFCILKRILDTNNMDQNEQFRRSRDHPTYETRIGGSKSFLDCLIIYSLINFIVTNI